MTLSCDNKDVITVMEMVGYSDENGTYLRTVLPDLGLGGSLRKMNPF